MSIEKTNKVPIDFIIAPATLASDSLTLVWDKPIEYADISGYIVYKDGERIAQTKQNKTHLTINGLTPNTMYKFHVEAIVDNTDDKNVSNTSTPNLNVKTKPLGNIIDVTQYPYSADGTGKNISTASVQKAIDDCEIGGTVLIPKSSVVLTGALELKSNMTFRVDGFLKGSLEPSDYIINKESRDNYKGLVNEDGLILTRYEGWEMYCYRSLINAGYLNPDNRMEVTCENLRICGEGTIYGGGNELGNEMKKLYADKEKYPEYVSDGIAGRRVRGRLLSFIQCKNVHLTGINIENPSCWTVHIIYCDTFTTHGVNIRSRGIDNGDGWDPDSSRNLMIFDTTFDTGDDCIAIKSGKNPDGNIVNIPTKNVRIFDLKMLGGHGMAIGSEESGGVEGIYMRDCFIQNTNYGLELKAHNSRGGYIKGLLMVDCVIDRFMAHSINYNADGIPAANLPYFKDIVIKNTIINGIGRGIELIGFTAEGKNNIEDHYVHGVLLENIILGNESDETGEIYLKACYDITFKNIKLRNGEEPKYIIDKDTVFNIKM
ncbi:MAG: glycoside hydrolase family 28 protein [Clostridium sp.]|uniref:glycoside hydrolase family 28 protein n=1 Tax=Clostridium sp. TaxID=1506 RepID=UPI00290F0FD2|nr:glycoside hydrolase family 28 protein [Clostridium sp.]MDU5110697.1 glycoside hydrolase family 28 protein [Clostridium sp.]